MLFALRGKEKGRPRISAHDAYSKLRGVLDWGQTQRQQGWICPLCAQPVFLKGAHVRIRNGLESKVDAHFCHYSSSAEALCLLLSPSSHHGLTSEAAHGIDHRQFLSLFYSLPQEYETGSWFNSQVREEAFLAVELLDKLGIGSFEEAERPFAWPIEKQRLPDSPLDFISLARTDENFIIGLRSYGLAENESLLNGPLSCQGRPNAIRRFLLETGKERKDYFRRIASSGQLTEHVTQATKLVNRLLADQENHLLWRAGFTASLRLIVTLLVETGFIESHPKPCADVISCIFLLPLVQPSKPKLEIVAHKSIKQVSVSSAANAKPDHNSRVHKSKKALWISSKIMGSLVAIDSNPAITGKSIKADGRKEWVSGNRLVVVPVSAGLLILSPESSLKFIRNPRDKDLIASFSENSLFQGVNPSNNQIIDLSDSGFRIDNRALQQLMSRRSSEGKTHPWRGIAPGQKKHEITSIGLLVYLSERHQ